MMICLTGSLMFIMSTDRTGNVGAGFANIQEITPLCKCRPGFRVIFLNNLSLRGQKVQVSPQSLGLDRCGLDRKRKWNRREKLRKLIHFYCGKYSHAGMLFTAHLFNKNRYRKVSDNFQHLSNPAARLFRCCHRLHLIGSLVAQMKTKLHRLSTPCQHQQQNNSETRMNGINTIQHL